MKVTVTINDKPVEIELTTAQVNAVKKASEKITDRVKSFEDACGVLNISPASLFALSDSVDERAYKKLKVVIKALNEGWVPNWSNGSEYKYFPYFEYNSGFGFSDSTVWDGYTDVGSRLVFKSRELSDYAGKQFNDIYNEYLDI